MRDTYQRFCFSRHIRQVTPKITYFFQNQGILRFILFDFENKITDSYLYHVLEACIRESVELLEFVDFDSQGDTFVHWMPVPRPCVEHGNLLPLEDLWEDVLRLAACNEAVDNVIEQRRARLRKIILQHQQP